MPSGSTISSFVADVVLLGVPQPIVMFVCMGIAVPLGYWGLNSPRRKTVDGERLVRLVAGLSLMALTTFMVLAMAFGRAMPGHEAELAASRDHLRYLPGLLLFGALCAGFVAIIHYFSQPQGHDRSPIEGRQHARTRAKRPNAYPKPGRRARTQPKRRGR